MNMKPCVYISGPMTGYERWNFPAFEAAASRLRSLGYPVVSPHDFGADPNISWEGCLKRDLSVLMHCEAVAVLDGWERSRGARLEVHVANELGMPVTPIADMK